MFYACTSAFLKVLNFHQGVGLTHVQSCCSRYLCFGFEPDSQPPAQVLGNALGKLGMSLGTRLIPSFLNLTHSIGGDHEGTFQQATQDCPGKHPSLENDAAVSV